MCWTRSTLAALGLILALASLACGARMARETIFEEEGVKVELRRYTKGGPVPTPTYPHPVTVADVRLAHILASLNYEDHRGKQRPTIRSEHVYPLAEGLARAASKAGPEDEIALAAFPIDRRLLVLATERVTVFRAVFEGDELRLEFFSIEEAKEKDPRADESYRIPMKPPSWDPAFKLVSGEGQRLVGSRTVMVDWRDGPLVEPLRATLPPVPEYQRGALSTPIRVTGEIRAIILARGILESFYNRGDWVTFFEVTEDSLREFCFENGKWTPTELDISASP